MTTYFIPTSDSFVEQIARSMAYDKMFAEADEEFRTTTGFPLDGNERLEKSFNFVFESLWESEDPQDLEQKGYYLMLARSAISAINLKMAVLG